MKTATRLLIALCLAPVPALAQDAAPAPAAPAPAKPAPAKPASATTSGSSEQEAGDVSEVDKDRLGPLRERVRPVSGHLFLKQGRFEFSPSATLSIKDAFFSKYILGGTLTYHPTETLGVSLRAGYSLNTVASAAQICTFSSGADGGTTRGCRRPTYAELDGEAPGQLTLMGGIDAQWAPIYGKISLMAEQFLHFDLYGVVGATAVQYRGPSKAAELTAGGNVGVGMRFFLNRWVTVRTEFRDLIYVEKALNPSTTLRNQLLFELGVSFFFPSAHPES
ncbi:outer membrane beta-barrel domain-containing protein [Archangium lansingense]|uniref:Outer membrane beta-barrel domain-containing protein n=1 Tax=Archangium lansingense TaxID=2995310 RepID=A0ABT4A498_9BACT|nr:outer membrane beta-barrel domain-containing protein [Archangium lansinium]MCY1076436.1 outer membrane beta-barrel domain-containing protein [Archangium lansinium]